MQMNRRPSASKSRPAVWCWVAIALAASLFGKAMLVQAADESNPRNGALARKIEERFRELDRDSNGKVTREEAGASLFDALNSDGNDHLTLAEAKESIRKLGIEAVLKLGGAKPATVPAESKAPLEPIRRGPKLLSPGDAGIGRQISDVSFTDVEGRKHTLSQLAKGKVLVVALTNTSCPVGLKFAPTLARLEMDFAEQGVSFLFVNPTASDKDSDIAQSRKTHGFQGPYVRDHTHSLAAALEATHTTDVFVLDGQRTLIYRGAIDDQYGFGYQTERPRHEYLVTAIRAVLENRRLPISATEAPGCPLERDNPQQSAETTITYHNRVSRILQSRCVECHRDGGVAPFPLDSLEAAVSHAGTIRRAVEQNVMPPWFAASPESGHVSPWGNDKSLSAREKADLLAWLNGGKPVGNPQDAPLPRSFPDGWQIGKPDLVVQLPKPITIKATGTMPYQNVIIPTELAEDRWVRSVEIRPTARAVVHHVLVFVLPALGPNQSRDSDAREDEGFFAAYAPGYDALVLEPGFAKKLPAGARLKLQLHYTPNGTATEDQTKIGIVFASEAPRHEVHVAGIANPRLSIPAGADNHPVSQTRTIPMDTTIVAFFPHMHLRGKSFRYEATFPDGRTTTLLEVPRYDFNWQLSYRLAEPVELPKGTVLKVTGWYDNSANNPANPDPKRTVTWGPQTDDEMMLGYVEYYPTQGQGTLGGPLANAGLDIESLFRRLDKNNDGKITEDEFPQIGRDRLKQADSNADGAITLEELQQLRKRLR